MDSYDGIRLLLFGLALVGAIVRLVNRKSENEKDLEEVVNDLKTFSSALEPHQYHPGNIDLIYGLLVNKQKDVEYFRPGPEDDLVGDYDFSTEFPERFLRKEFESRKVDWPGSAGKALFGRPFGEPFTVRMLMDFLDTHGGTPPLK